MGDRERRQAFAARAIIERSDLELAGVKVYSEAKRGVDAGELLGRDPVGIQCVADLEDVLAIDADCVSYNGLGATEEGAFDRTVEELCTLLRNGFNVTASALEHLIYPPMVPDSRAKLETACIDGGTSFYDTGINPGYAMDFWPLTLSRLSRSIERIRLLEVVDMKRYEREEGVTEADIEVAVGTLDAGTVAVHKMNFVGVVGGRDFFVNSWVWRMSDDVHPEWGTGDYWECEILGDPNVRSRLELRTDYDAPRPVSLAVATLNVNAIPTLCQVPPGVYTNLTLANFAGGYRTVAGVPVTP